MMRGHPVPFLLHQLLDPELGFGFDVALKVMNGDGNYVVEGELKAHSIILALGSPVFRVSFFSQSGGRMSSKVEELKGASMKTVQWMLDFLYSKPDEECGWSGASAEELSQLASLADRLQIVQLQRKVNICTSIVSSCVLTTITDFTQLRALKKSYFCLNSFAVLTFTGFLPGATLVVVTES